MSASILLPTVVWPSNRRGLDALHMEILSYITAIKKGQNLVQRGQISCKWKWSTNWFNNWMFFLHNLTNRIIFANEVQTDLIQELTKILEHSFCEWSTNWFDNCLVTAINQELRVFFLRVGYKLIFKSKNQHFTRRSNFETSFVFSSFLLF